MALKNPLLTAYWFETTDPQGPLGLGVTAYSLADARWLIRHSGYAPWSLGAAREVRDLDALLAGLRLGQLARLCAPLIFRGRWYPAWCWWMPVEGPPWAD